jgi:hypothetical protein
MRPASRSPSAVPTARRPTPTGRSTSSLLERVRRWGRADGRLGSVAADLPVGRTVTATVVDAIGVDLVAEVGVANAGPAA